MDLEQVHVYGNSAQRPFSGTWLIDGEHKIRHAQSRRCQCNGSSPLPCASTRDVTYSWTSAMSGDHTLDGPATHAHLLCDDPQAVT